MNEIFTGPVSSQAKLVSILGTLGLVIIIAWLIKKGHLRAGYSLLWFLLIGAMLVFSVSPTALFVLSGLLGIYYPPAAIFAVLAVMLILISIHFSVVITKHERRIKRLGQEVALLRKKLKGKRKSSRVLGSRQSH